MNESRFHLGVDIAKATLRAALLSPEGTWREADFDNNRGGHTRLLAWLGGERARTRVCMEATGAYGVELTVRLHAEGVPVAVANARLVRDFGRSLNCRTKNDPVDARIIARYSRERAPALWTPPEAITARLRSLFARRDALMKTRVAESNRREGADDEMLEDIQAHIDWLNGRIDAIDGKIASAIDASPELKAREKLLRTIPGIGAQSAARFLWFVDVKRYGSARKLAAHAGLTPSERQSGTSVHARARISKIGRKELRKTLFMPALSACEGEGFTPWVAKLRAAGKTELVIRVAVMHRMLRIAYGVLKSGQPYSPTKAFGLT